VISTGVVVVAVLIGWHCQRSPADWAVRRG
jgi:hypothetical protein